jgi:hypothetical protein
MPTPMPMPIPGGALSVDNGDPDEGVDGEEGIDRDAQEGAMRAGGAGEGRKFREGL